MDTTSTFFWRGLIIGFSIAAPVGPIGILCIRRTLVSGRIIGFISGLGAASADACYGLIAGLGLTIISAFLIKQQTWLGLIGGLFLCYLGIKTFIDKPALEELAASNSPLNLNPGHQRKLAVRAYGSTFILTLTNPLTILSFAAIFAALGLASSNHQTITAAALVLGVFIGSASWWLLLTFGTDYVRRLVFRAQPGQNSSLSGNSEPQIQNYRSVFQWVNWVSGALITAFGLVALYRTFLSL